MEWNNQRGRPVILAVALGLLTLVVFWPVTSQEFLRYDDPIYVQENPHVTRGISLTGLAWAFTTGHASNWHPVTWLSHMLDAQMFGLRPAGHHFTSLLLHAVNAALLCLLLVRLTGLVGRSLCVAALFALHPLHVESVAWLAERKDVLSMLFFLLALWAYADYARAPRPSPLSAVPRPSSPAPSFPWRAYTLALLFFALGLMSKPMLVTLPFVLLLLDAWPLNRLPALGEPGWLHGLKPLVREKVPFFVLTLLSSWVTYAVQAQTHAVTLVLPLWSRLVNAIVSYVKYLGKMFWPADLAVFYPHPDTRWPVSEQWPLWLVGICTVALLGISVLAILNMKRRGWLFTGWFWYLGTLVPVLGLVQVGGQAMADRYTYIPLTGLFICLVWGAAELLGARPWSRQVLGSAAGLAVLVCVVATHQQLKPWRTNFTLFEHALSVTKTNAVAHCHLGAYYGEQGQYERAIAHFQAAQAAAPALADGYYGLGYTLELQGKHQDAIAQYEAALRLKPWDDWIHNRFGLALWTLGEKEKATQHFSQAVRLRPDSIDARYNLANALADQGNLAEAVVQLAEVARLNPEHREAIKRLAELLLALNRMDEAEARFRQLSALAPNDPDARINLGGVLWRNGRRPEALQQYSIAVQLKPDHALARFNLGTALFALGRFGEAAASYAEAARLKPDYAEAFTGAGRALVALAKYDEAIAQFQQALALRRDAFTLFNLGIAQANSGHHKAAIASFRETLALQPDWPPALNELAWLLATSPDAALRDGAEALRLASKAAESTARQDPRILSTLDAAYGEVGQFAEAIATAEKVRQMALAAKALDMAKAAADRIEQYKRGQPFHEQAEPAKNP